MTDSKEIITCPACGKEMQKVFLNSVQFNVDICLNGCGGLFLDNREYKKVTETPEAIQEINNAVKGREFRAVDKSYKRFCPVCKMKMMKNSTSLKNQIIIDECYGCGSKFLDNGELEKIKNEYSSEAERSQEMANYLRQAMGSEFDEMHVNQTLKSKKPKKQGILDSIVKKFM